MSPRRTSTNFGREYSLKSDTLIRQIRLSGKRMAGRVLDVKHLVLNDDRKQFCIKIPRHVGNAVRRNRIKRVIREIIRHNLDQIQPGTKAILFVRKDPGRHEADTLGEEIQRAFSNA